MYLILPISYIIISIYSDWSKCLLVSSYWLHNHPLQVWLLSTHTVRTHCTVFLLIKFNQSSYMPLQNYPLFWRVDVDAREIHRRVPSLVTRLSAVCFTTLYIHICLDWWVYLLRRPNQSSMLGCWGWTDLNTASLAVCPLPLLRGHLTKQPLPPSSSL